MAWIKVDQTLRDHHKILELSEILDISVPTAIGHVVMLWTWSLDNAPDGVLPGPRALARICDWTGDPKQFLDALVQVAFVDQVGTKFEVHNWGEYAGSLIEKRERAAERMRHVRATEREPDAHVSETYGERAANVPRTDAARSRERASNVSRTLDERAANVSEPSRPTRAKSRDRVEVDAFTGVNASNAHAREPGTNRSDDVDWPVAKRIFDSYLAGIDVTPQSPDYLAIESRERPDLIALIDYANPPDDLLILETSVYLAERWRAGNYRGRPKLRDVLAATGEFQRWDADGRPALKNGTGKNGKPDADYFARMAAELEQGTDDVGH